MVIAAVVLAAGWLACGVIPAIISARRTNDMDLSAIAFCALLGPLWLAMYLHGGDDIEDDE